MDQKEKTKKRSRAYPVFVVLLIVGALLIVSACGMLLAKRLIDKSAIKRHEEVVERLRALWQDGEIGLLEEGEDPKMPAIEIDGVDYIGRISVERFGADVAVTSDWNTGWTSALFCRAAGSLYDKTLVVGANNDAGQFDFFYRVDAGDQVRFTDAEGVTYVYEVGRAARASSFDPSAKAEADLTLYLHNRLSMEYIVLYCNTAH